MTGTTTAGAAVSATSTPAPGQRSLMTRGVRRACGEVLPVRRLAALATCLTLAAAGPVLADSAKQHTGPRSPSGSGSPVTCTCTRSTDTTRASTQRPPGIPRHGPRGATLVHATLHRRLHPGAAVAGGAAARSRLRGHHRPQQRRQPDRPRRTRIAEARTRASSRLPGYENSQPGHVQMLGARSCYGNNGAIDGSIIECDQAGRRQVAPPARPRSPTGCAPTAACSRSTTRAT